MFQPRPLTPSKPLVERVGSLSGPWRGNAAQNLSEFAAAGSKTGSSDYGGLLTALPASNTDFLLLAVSGTLCNCRAAYRILLIRYCCRCTVRNTLIHIRV